MKDYVVNGKVVEITLDNGNVVKAETAYLKNSMERLEIDMDEAVLTWLEDEGYLMNDDQEELNAKAKDNKVLASLHRTQGNKPAAKTQRERVVKTNPVKESIIAAIANLVTNLEGAEDVVIENKGKIITFKMGTEEFKIDLIQKRKAKDKNAI